MKVKALSRDSADHLRQTVNDIQKVQRNIDPALHPLEKAREYTRALNATKLERVFAKPFVGALSGHSDGVFTMAKHPLRLSALLSGACDGEIKIWNLVTKAPIRTIFAHRGYVRGLAVSPLGDYIVSVGDDKHIKLWKFDYDQLITQALENKYGDPTLSKNNNNNSNVNNSLTAMDVLDAGESNPDVPTSVIIGKNVFTGCDHHRKDFVFATSGSVVEIWDAHRSDPIESFSWGADTVTSVKFNPIETNVLASTGSDRHIGLYDIRSNSPLRKVILAMRTNAIAWNPMEAFNFTAANEDNNCYTFDMRRLDKALNVHTDHVSAVMDIDYSPTGREFVTGAYDKSLRIYRYNEGHSRDIYHAKRMQRIFSVKWSSDAKFVFCGSDETNIRIWKADASEKLGTLLPRERAAFDYNEKLKETFKHHPDIKRIARHRHVPKAIHSAAKEKRTMIDARKNKENNRRMHSKPGDIPFKIERRKHIVTQLK